MPGVGIEDDVAAGWLTSVLEGDSQLAGLAPGGVWDGPANEGTLMPFIRFDMQTARVVRGIGTIEIEVNSLWLVRAVCEGTTYLPLAPVVRRIHSLLHGVAVQTVSDGTIHVCVREDPFRQPSIEGGRQTRHLGAIYRIFVQGS